MIIIRTIIRKRKWGSFKEKTQKTEIGTYK